MNENDQNNSKENLQTNETTRKDTNKEMVEDNEKNNNGIIEIDYQEEEKDNFVTTTNEIQN